MKSKEYVLNDNFIYDVIEEKIESIPLELLREIRVKMINEKSDTKVIDKIINQKESNEEIELTNTDLLHMISLVNLTNNLTKNSNLMSWEQKEVDNGNYEPYNFEEEELEEDDYYFDDDN